ENRQGEKTSNEFSKIPGKSIAYWVSKDLIENFDYNLISSELKTREGMATANNELFLKNWQEVNYTKINFNSTTSEEALNSKYKWFPYNKGGNYRKWYGNNIYIVNWENDGYEIRHNIDSRTGRVRSHNYNGDYAFRKGITWSALSSGNISVRYSKEGFLFNSKGAKGLCENESQLIYILSLLNSNV